MSDEYVSINSMPLDVLLGKIKGILESARNPANSNVEPELLLSVGILIQANEEKIIQAIETQLEMNARKYRIEALHKYNITNKEALSLNTGYCLVINGVVFRDEPSEKGQPIIIESRAQTLITDWLDIAIEELGTHAGQDHSGSEWNQHEDRWEIVNLRTAKVEYQGEGDSALPELLKG